MTGIKLREVPHCVMSVRDRDGLGHHPPPRFARYSVVITRMLNLGCEQLVPASPSSFQAQYCTSVPPPRTTTRQL